MTMNWNAGQLPALGSIWAFVAALAMIAMSYFHFKSGYLNPKPQGGEDAGQ